MRFYAFGKTSDPVILLLPGTCCHWKLNFGEVIPHLEPHFRVVCVSYDGFDETEDTVFPNMLTETEKIEKYIREKRYPDVQGFSPRNLRRMRDFCRTYENHPAALSLAMNLSWTQNVVIMEADLTMELREWYLRATRQFGWSKTELTARIAEQAHLENVLDMEIESVTRTAEQHASKASTKDNPTFSERKMSDFFGCFRDK